MNTSFAQSAFSHYNSSMSLTRSLALNTGVQVAGKIVSTALGLAIIGLLTRLLGTEGFGAYSTANAFLQIFALLLDLGLNVTLVALLGEHAGDEAYERRCTSALFTLRIVMALLVLGIFAPFVAFLSPYPLELKLAIIALTGSFFFPSLNQVVTGVEQRHLKMHAAAIAENVGRVVTLAGLFIAVAFHFGIVPIMWIISFAGFANFFTNFLSARKFAHFGWNWDPEFWLEALKRSWPVGLSIAFGLLYFKADTIIMSFSRSQAEVGIYGAAYRVLEILITVPFMYAGVLLPILSNAWAKRDQARFKKLLSASIDVMAVLVIPIIVGTWLLGVRIMTIVAGPEFADSGRILSVLILAIGAIYLNTVFSHSVVAIDAQRSMLPFYAFVAISALTGYLILIPTYGMWAAAWITVASEVIIGLGSLYVTKKALPIGYKPRATLAAIASSAVMALTVWPLRNMWIVLPIFVGALTYTIMIVSLGGIPMEIIREVLKKKKDTTPFSPLT